MFANKLFSRVESRSTEYTDLEKVFMDIFGINGEFQGDALKETTYFTCIKIISEAIAKVPIYITQETDKGDRRAREHYLYEKLCLRPNPYMTAVDFWKAIEANRQHTGRGCALIERGKNNKVKNLYPVIFKRMIVDDAGIIGKENAILVEYKFTHNGKTQDCLYKDIIDLKSFTLDGINSKSNRSMIHETISTNIKSQKYLNQLFDAGLTNKIVVQLTSDIKEEKELRKIQDKFRRIYSGDGRIFTVPAGYNVQAMNLSLSDAQFEQLRRMSISQIASSFGIKMFQLNDLKDTNNNSLEQQQLSFLIDTLLILFESIEQEIDWKLLSPYERLDGYKCRFNTNVMLRTDAKTQAEILCQYVSTGIYEPNYPRRLLGVQDKEGGEDLVVNAGVLKMKDIGKGGENKNE